ncbi:MAG TPA: hypothetical protein VK447_18160 [Myxococcaceae bacterium]|nr:hypothetical protein [Myxococcaceae bacterium]
MAFRTALRLLATGLMLQASFAWGEEPPPDEGEAAEPSPEDRIDALEERISELEAQLQAAKTQTAAKPRAPLVFHGYADVGFFVPFGTGAGAVQDFGGRAFPDLRNQYGWVFLGDLLATPVNSRGDPADLGDLPGVSRFDPIHARGAPGFLVNEVNLRATVGLAENVLVTTSVNLLPRTGSEFSLGDFVEVDQAQLEWLPFADGKTSLFVGKFDSVIGLEYRERKAHARFGITPTLLHRYTSGTPLGLKARTKLFDEKLIIAAALTNGSSTTEQFHLYSETDTNWGKTVSGRVAVRLPIAGTLELGVSGLIGPQDRARDSSRLLTLVGADLQYTTGTFTLKAQYLRGGQPGKAEDGVYGLDLQTGAYVEANWMIVPALGVIVRGEVRDAFVWLGSERAYLTRSWRAVGGLRYSITEGITLKAEYLRNGEYGGVPDIRNDLFTSSLVLAY